MRITIIPALAVAAVVLAMPAYAQDASSETILQKLLPAQPPQQPSPRKPLTRSFVSRGIDVHQKIEIDGVQSPGGNIPDNSARIGEIAAVAPGKINLQINFERGSAVLSPSARTQLDNLAEALSDPRLKTKRIRIAGHTDATGGEDFNIQLSRSRANAVRDYLAIYYGLDRSKFETIGYGKNELIDPANPMAAENRRVEIVNLGG